MSRARLLALLLALVTLLVYLPVTRHGFLDFDDDDYVTNNRMVQAGWTLAGIQWAFATFHAANWHPVTWLSHMTDCEFFNLNAGAHHAVNVMFHAANAALVLLWLWRLTGKIWPSALVAALFAWHPLHVESVAWVAERKDVLSTCFGLLALLSYTRFARTASARHLWLAVFCFAMSLMAKPMLVTLPFVLLLLDYWPLQRFSPGAFRWSLVLEKTPFFLLAAASCIMTLLAQRAGHALVSLGMVPLAYRLENAVVSVACYLLKLLWPADLAVVYPPASISVATLALALIALTVISAAVLLARRHRCWLVGWLWFLGTLVPVIGLVRVGSASMADRYTYIPSLGIFIALAFGLPELVRSKRMLAVGAALLLIACVATTERQLTYWRDSVTLFRHALAITPNNGIAHLNLATALDRQGRAAEALVEYREVMRINPNYPQIHFAIGNELMKLGQPAAALAEYRQCLRGNPDAPDLHNAIACALAAQGEFDGARREFAEAERLDPHYAQPHLELARIFLSRGQGTNAIAELGAAVQAAPNAVPALLAAARVLAANEDAAARDGHTALVLAIKANELSDGRQPEVFDVLGMAFAETGDFTNAVICAQNALQFSTASESQNSGPLRQRLELYRTHRPWRESFRATNAPPEINPAK